MWSEIEFESAARTASRRSQGHLCPQVLAILCTLRPNLAILQVAFAQADVHPLIVVAGTAAPLPDGAAGRAVAASAREDAAASVGDPQRGHAFEEEAAEAVVGDAPG